MDTTGTLAMGKSLSKLWCMTALHKFYKPEQYIDIDYSMFYTMGIKQEEIVKLNDVEKVLGHYPPLLLIDVANSYTKHAVEFCSQLRTMSPNSIIMIGNVATPEMVQELVINGKADIIKIGIGPGSVCTTAFSYIRMC
jgi:GMP reductase